MCRTSLFSTGPAVHPDHAIWFAENRLLWRRRRRFGQFGLPGNWLLRGLTQRDCPRNEHGRPSPPQVQSRPWCLRVQTEWCDPTKTKPSRRENNFRGGWASRAESPRPRTATERTATQTDSDALGNGGHCGFHTTHAKVTRCAQVEFPPQCTPWHRRSSRCKRV